MTSLERNKASSASLDMQDEAFAKSKSIATHDFYKFSLYSVGLVAVCLLAFLFAALRMTVKPLRIQVPGSGMYSNFYPEVSLTAEVILVDPVARTIAMNWYPTFTSITCQDDPSDPSVYDIFLKSDLLDVTSPTFSSQLVDQPVYRLNSTAICQGIISGSGSFRTVTKLTASKAFLELQLISDRGPTFQNYPFDVYLAPFLFYTRKFNDSAITALQVSDSFGIAVNFQISLLRTEYLLRDNDQSALQFYLHIERSLGTKTFVVLVAISNWLTATAFLIISAATLVYRHHKIYSEMFVVPVGALFAFSSIRANLPGAPPGFGATIDLFTIIPVLVIMSFCDSLPQSFGLLLIVLYRRICEDVKKNSEIIEAQLIAMELDTPTTRILDLGFSGSPEISSRRQSLDVPKGIEQKLEGRGSRPSSINSNATVRNPIKQEYNQRLIALEMML